MTQLFTEHYMVQFLLHNTIGAWWCGRHGIKGPAGGAGVPAGLAPVEMEYLRWRDDGTPAAGTFDGWPKTLGEFTLLDPCCGSGHFLVSAFNLLVPLRMHDEGLSAQEACDAVLRCNLFGLELDPRCTQIAAFALALAAWKYPGEDGQPLGYRSLLPLNIACSGQGVAGKRHEWLSLANDDARLRAGMERLYDLFQQAPHLGSLIDPRREQATLFEAGYAELQPLLATALARHAGDADLVAVGVAAQGIAKAADLFRRTYTLLATNVPYLGRGRQAEVISTHLDKEFALGKADLATAFVLLCFEYCKPGGTVGLVTPQNWLFLTSYKKLREESLSRRRWNLVARLGPRAFETISGEVVNVALLVITAEIPTDATTMAGLDVAEAKTPAEKAARLADFRLGPVQVVRQADQMRNPDSLINLDTRASVPLLNRCATAYRGQCTGDSPRYEMRFWEVGLSSDWAFLQGAPQVYDPFTGRESVVLWEGGHGTLRRVAEELRRIPGHNGIRPTRGDGAWGKQGVVFKQMSDLTATLYTGEIFDGSCSAVIPDDPSYLLPLWAYASSPEFASEVRRLNRKVNVENGFLTKVPFDLAHWQAVAAVQYPNGLPEPHSDDPTQWLFKGDVATTTDSLQVAVARLLAYRWPEQPATPDAVDVLAATSGIVCLPGVRGEPPASERLLEVLRAAYGGVWSNDVLARLLTDAGCRAGASLYDWLTASFFDQHCKRFHNRPFIWHVWDGRKDGFSCLVNYHKLNHKTLENLTYSYLGDWITAQTADARAGKTGADLRLAAAQALQEKLKLILAGEPPYDVFVRWKLLSEQSIGWNPDLNDGVRMNIRPFVQAGVLRKNPTIKWTKDRGKEPKRARDEFPWFWDGDRFTGDRINDVHLSNAVKRATRR